MAVAPGRGGNLDILPGKVVDTFHALYGAQANLGDLESFRDSVFQRGSVTRVEKMADTIYQHVYPAGDFPREEFDKDMGLAEWRGEMNNAISNTVRGAGERALDLYAGWFDMASVLADTLGAPEISEGAKAIADNARNVDLGYQARNTWQDVKDDPLENAFAFALNEGFKSLPDMLLFAARWPGYFAQVGGHAGGLLRERAAKDKREGDPTFNDLAVALPLSAIVGLLDRFGAQKVFGITDALKEGGLTGVGKAVGRAGVAESATEAAQESLEEFGTGAGTETGTTLAGVAEAGAQGALVGGIFGSTLRGGTATFQAARGDFPAEPGDPIANPIRENLVEQGFEEEKVNQAVSKRDTKDIINFYGRKRDQASRLDAFQKDVAKEQTERAEAQASGQPVPEPQVTREAYGIDPDGVEKAEKFINLMTNKWARSMNVKPTPEMRRQIAEALDYAFENASGERSPGDAAAAAGGTAEDRAKVFEAARQLWGEAGINLSEANMEKIELALDRIWKLLGEGVSFEDATKQVGDQFFTDAGGQPEATPAEEPDDVEKEGEWPRDLTEEDANEISQELYAESEDPDHERQRKADFSKKGKPRVEPDLGVGDEVIVDPPGPDAPFEATVVEVDHEGGEVHISSNTLADSEGPFAGGDAEAVLSDGSGARIYSTTEQDKQKREDADDYGVRVSNAIKNYTDSPYSNSAQEEVLTVLGDERFETIEPEYQTTLKNLGEEIKTNRVRFKEYQSEVKEFVAYAKANAEDPEIRKKAQELLDNELFSGLSFPLQRTLQQILGEVSLEEETEAETETDAESETETQEEPEPEPEEETQTEEETEETTEPEEGESAEFDRLQARADELHDYRQGMELSQQFATITEDEEAYYRQLDRFYDEAKKILPSEDQERLSELVSFMESDLSDLVMENGIWAGERAQAHRLITKYKEDPSDAKTQSEIIEFLENIDAPQQVQTVVPGGGNVVAEGEAADTTPAVGERAVGEAGQEMPVSFRNALPPIAFGIENDIRKRLEDIAIEIRQESEPEPEEDGGDDEGGGPGTPVEQEPAEEPEDEAQPDATEEGELDAIKRRAAEIAAAAAEFPNDKLIEKTQTGRARMRAWQRINNLATSMQRAKKPGRPQKWIKEMEEKWEFLQRSLVEQEKTDELTDWWADAVVPGARKNEVNFRDVSENAEEKEKVREIKRRLESLKIKKTLKLPESADETAQMLLRYMIQQTPEIRDFKKYVLVNGAGWQYFLRKRSIARVDAWFSGPDPDGFAGQYDTIEDKRADTENLNFEYKQLEEHAVEYLSALNAIAFFFRNATTTTDVLRSAIEAHIALGGITSDALTFSQNLRNLGEMLNYRLHVSQFRDKPPFVAEQIVEALKGVNEFKVVHAKRVVITSLDEYGDEIKEEIYQDEDGIGVYRGMVYENLETPLEGYFVKINEEALTEEAEQLWQDEDRAAVRANVQKIIRDGGAGPAHLIRAVTDSDSDLKDMSELIAVWKQRLGEEFMPIKRFNVLDYEHIRDESRPDFIAEHGDGDNFNIPEIAKRLGLVGLEFGNWTNAGEAKRKRATYMRNLGLLALFDLADALGIPQDRIGSLFLTLAIGSRGRGRHSAHYERETNVINLTLTKGDGSLAHEWGHFFDLFLATQKGDESNLQKAKHHIHMVLQTKGPNLDDFKKTVNYWLRKGGFGESKEERIAVIEETINKFMHDPDWQKYLGERNYKDTAFRESAIKLDGKEDGYWSRPAELWARSFEAFVADRAGFTNRFLVDSEYVGEETKDRVGWKDSPYPTGEERQLFNDMYAALFEGMTFDENGVPDITDDALSKILGMGKDSTAAHDYVASILEVAADKGWETLILRAEKHIDLLGDSIEDASELDDEPTHSDFGQSPALTSDIDKYSDEQLERFKVIAAEQILEETGRLPNAEQLDEIEAMFTRPKKKAESRKPPKGNAFSPPRSVEAKRPRPTAMALKSGEEILERMQVRNFRKWILEGGSAQTIFEKAVEMAEAYPDAEMRTEVSKSMGAYSTPLWMAFAIHVQLETWKANSVLEYSAGNGALLAGTRKGIDRYAVNELQPSRAAFLKGEGWTDVTMEDAADPHSYARLGGQKFDLVMANPPFGARIHLGVKQEWTVGDFTTTRQEYAMALESLKHLSPEDGKAAIIVGAPLHWRKDDKDRAQEYMKGQRKEFFKQLHNNYKIVKHVTMAPMLYEDQGVSFPVDLIFIDQAAKNTAKPPWLEAPKLLERHTDVAAELIDQSIRVPAHSSVSKERNEERNAVKDDAAAVRLLRRTHAKASRGLSGQIVEDERESAGTEAPAPTTRTTAGGREADVTGYAEEAVTLPTEQERSASEMEAARIRDDATPDVLQDIEGENRGKASEWKPAENADAQTRSTVPETTLFEQESSESNFFMPDTLDSALASGMKNLERYVGNINEYVMQKLGMEDQNLYRKAFNPDQRIALAAAIYAHEHGYHFILGDMTGVGKGRVLLGMALYAKNQGLTPIYVTRNPQLYNDIARDVRAVGLEELYGGRKLKAFTTHARTDVALSKNKAMEVVSSGQHSEVSERMKEISKEFDEHGRSTTYDLILTTYDQMSPTRGEQGYRHEFMRSVAPRSFLIMDESHLAGGSKGGFEKNLVSSASFFRELLDKMQRMRGDAESEGGAVFASATFAKNPSVFTLYRHTILKDLLPAGLMENPGRLEEFFAEGGHSIVSYVTWAMSHELHYLRRELDFSRADFKHAVTEVNRESYEEVSELINKIADFQRKFTTAIFARARAEGVLDDINIRERAELKFDYVDFVATAHNLMDQALLALKSKHSVEIVVEALERGEKPVLTLENTMASVLNEIMDRKGIKKGESFEMDFRDIIMRYLERTREYTISWVDENGLQQETRSITDLMLAGFHGGTEAVEIYNDIKDQIEKSHFLKILPASPIDYLKSALQGEGYKVDELTGRSHQIVYPEGDIGRDNLRYEPRPARGTVANTKAVEGFNSGSLDVVIANRSGSTGISIHASSEVKDQRPRHMIMLQSLRDVNDQVQMFGRIFRTGIVNTPLYTLLSADVPIESRYSDFLLQKVRMLNAAVSAKEGSALVREGPALLPMTGRLANEVAAEILERWETLNPMLHNPGTWVQTKAKGRHIRVDPDLAQRLTGRSIMLSFDEQTRLMNEMQEGMRLRINEMKASGTPGEHESGVEDLRAVARGNAYWVQRPNEKVHKDNPAAFGVRAQVFEVEKTSKPYSPLELVNLAISNVKKEAEDLAVDKVSFAEIEAAGPLQDVLRTKEGREEWIRSLDKAGGVLAEAIAKRVNGELYDFIDSARGRSGKTGEDFPDFQYEAAQEILNLVGTGSTRHDNKKEAPFTAAFDSLETFDEEEVAEILDVAREFTGIGSHSEAALDRFIEHRNEKIELQKQIKALKEDGKSAKKSEKDMRAKEDRWNKEVDLEYEKVRAFTNAMRDIVHVGQLVELKQGFLNMPAYIIGVNRQNPDSPIYKPGSWRVTFATVSGDRTLTLPMSRITREENDPTRWEINRVPLHPESMTIKYRHRYNAGAKKEGLTVFDLFEQASTAGREERVFFFGNLIEAWYYLRGIGHLIQFTRVLSDGRVVVEHGVVLPRGISLQQALELRPIRVGDPDVMTEYFKNVGSSARSATNARGRNPDPTETIDGLIRIHIVYDEARGIEHERNLHWYASAPSSSSKSRYVQDTRLNNVLKGVHQQVNDEYANFDAQWSNLKPFEKGEPKPSTRWMYTNPVRLGDSQGLRAYLTALMDSGAEFEVRGNRKMLREAHEEVGVQPDFKIADFYSQQSKDATGDPEVLQAIREEVARLLPGVKVIGDAGIAAQYKGKKVVLGYTKGMQFKDADALISVLFSQDKGTIYHEALHAMKMLGLIRPNEWKILLEWARQNNLLEKHNVKRRWGYNSDKFFDRGHDLPTEKAWEEALAEEFQEFMEGRAKPTFVRRIFIRIVDFFLNLARRLQIMGFEPSAEWIFESMAAGVTGRRDWRRRRQKMKKARDTGDWSDYGVEHTVNASTRFAVGATLRKEYGIQVDLMRSLEDVKNDWLPQKDADLPFLSQLPTGFISIKLSREEFEDFNVGGYKIIGAAADALPQKVKEDAQKHFGDKWKQLLITDTVNNLRRAVPLYIAPSEKSDRVFLDTESMSLLIRVAMEMRLNPGLNLLAGYEYVNDFDPTKPNQRRAHEMALFKLSVSKNWITKERAGQISPAYRSGVIGHESNVMDGLYDPFKPEEKVPPEGLPRFEFDKKETRDRWNKASISEEQSFADIRSALDMAKRGMRYHAELEGQSPHWAEWVEYSKHLHNARHNAAIRVANYYKQVMGGLNDLDYEHLNVFFVLKDLANDAAKGIDLAFGYKNTKEVEKDLANIRKIIKSRPHLAKRVKLRYELMDEMRKELIESGVLKGPLSREYFHHHIVEYRRLMNKVGFTSDKVYKRKQFGREGSEKDFYPQMDVEAEWMFRALMDIAVAKHLNYLRKSKYNVYPEWRNLAKARNNLRLTEAIREEFSKAVPKRYRYLVKALEAAKDPREISYVLRAKIRADMKKNEEAAQELKTAMLRKMPLFAEWTSRQQEIAMRFGIMRKVLKGLNDEQRNAFPRKVLLGVQELEGENGKASLMDESETSYAFTALNYFTRNPVEGRLSKAALLLFGALAKREHFRKLNIPGYLNPRSRKDLIAAFDKKGEYRTWQPDAPDPKRQSLMLFTGKTISERLMERMMEHLLPAIKERTKIDPAEIKDILDKAYDATIIGGPMEQFILEKPLAETLDNFHDKQLNNAFWEATKRFAGFLKQWLLFNPVRFPMYYFRNMMSDIDALIGNQIMRETLKNVRNQAWTEYRSALRGGKMTDMLKMATEMGVIQSGFTSKEMPDSYDYYIDEKGNFNIKRMRWTLLSAAPNMIKTYLNYMMYLARLRENSFRYAAFLTYYDKIVKQNQTFRQIGYGAANPKILSQLGSKEHQAAYMARSAMGDYSDLSGIERRAANHYLWFLRWLSSNSRRYTNLIANAWRYPRDMHLGATDPNLADSAKAGAEFVKSSMFVAAGISARLTAHILSFYVLMNVWNHLFWWDDEKKLSPDERLRPHVNLWTMDDGTVVSMRFHAAFPDFISIFGLGNIGSAAQDMANGLISLPGFLLEMAKAPFNRIANMLTPLVKVPLELVTGSLYPDAFNPRQVDDGVKHVMKLFSFDPEWAQFNKWIIGESDPTPPYKERLLKIAFARQDQKKMAYQEIRSRVFRFMDSKGMAGTGSPRKDAESVAVRHWKLAKKYKDRRSEKLALKEMKRLGVSSGRIKAVVRSAHPLGRLPGRFHEEFEATLSKSDKKLLNTAGKYWEETFLP